MVEPVAPPLDTDDQQGEAARLLCEITRLLGLARRTGLDDVIEALEAAKLEAERLVASRLDS